jgi:hypothetical protein
MTMMFHILLLSLTWAVILVAAIYPPQHHQTCWILSTCIFFEKISSQLSDGINHSLTYYGFLPHFETQKLGY